LRRKERKRKSEEITYLSLSFYETIKFKYYNIIGFWIKLKYEISGCNLGLHVKIKKETPICNHGFIQKANYEHAMANYS